MIISTLFVIIALASLLFYVDYKKSVKEQNQQLDKFIKLTSKNISLGISSRGVKDRPSVPRPNTKPKPMRPVRRLTGMDVFLRRRESHDIGIFERKDKQGKTIHIKIKKIWTKPS